MGEKIRIVLDTNVWVSIFTKKALSREFTRVFADEKVQVFISKEILNEISKVLVYPKLAELFKRAGTHPREILKTIVENSTPVKPKRRVKIIKEDPADNRILECALEANCDFIVSGDKHLLRLRKFKRTRILSPREFVELIS